MLRSDAGSMQREHIFKLRVVKFRPRLSTVMRNSACPPLSEKVAGIVLLQYDRISLDIQTYII